MEPRWVPVGSGGVRWRPVGSGGMFIDTAFQIVVGTKFVYLIFQKVVNTLVIIVEISSLG